MLKQSSSLPYINYNARAVDIFLSIKDNLSIVYDKHFKQSL